MGRDAEEHRTAAVDALCLALAASGSPERKTLSGFDVTRARTTYRSVAESIVDHITAHAVETARDLAEADDGLRSSGVA